MVEPGSAQPNLVHESLGGLRGPHGEAVDDLGQKIRVGVDLPEPHPRALGGFFGEAAGALLAHLEDVAVTVQHVVDDLEEEPELGGERAPRAVLRRRDLGRPDAAHHRGVEQGSRLQRMEVLEVGRSLEIELLAADACRAARSAPSPPPQPDDARPYGRPTARELLEAVHEFLTDRVMASDDRALAYHGRVAANALGIVERELARLPITHEGDDWFALALQVIGTFAIRRIVNVEF